MTRATQDGAVEAALEALAQGRMVVLTDDADRENEGDVVMAAEFADAKAIAFMAARARGLICLALEPAQVERLGLAMMTRRNESPHGTAFTVSIEAATGVTTGISAADRARTIAVAIDPASTSADIVSPGHMFPLRADPAGVLARPGHTEGAVDLARAAGLRPAGVICEIMNEDGTMASGARLEAFARAHDLPMLSIAELTAWRARKPVTAGAGPHAAPASRVTHLAETALPSRFGGADLRLHAFTDDLGNDLVALVHGDPAAATDDPPLVRLHSECLTGDAFGSLRCDCGAQLQEALHRITEAPCGIVVYLRGHEGRGIGLTDKIRAYALQDGGLDTVDANRALGLPDDARDYATAAAVLRHFDIRRVVLLGNNPAKAEALARHGVAVARRERLEVGASPFNHHYLATKRTRMGHDLRALTMSFEQEGTSRS